MKAQRLVDNAESISDRAAGDHGWRSSQTGRGSTKNKPILATKAMVAADIGLYSNKVMRQAPRVHPTDQRSGHVTTAPAPLSV